MAASSRLYTDAPEPRRAEHQHIPPPDDPRSLIILAARWLSHDLDARDMPGIAADLLELGYDIPSTRRLAGEVQVNHSADIAPWVDRMFRELGVPFPLPEDEAKMITSRQIAREVIGGLRNAWEAASYLEIAIWALAPRDSDLRAIFDIRDEVDWDTGCGRPLPELKTALIEAFARLAVAEIVIAT